jgi:hypothetical protein
MTSPRADPIRYQATLDGQTTTIHTNKMMVRSIISTIEPDRVGDIVVPKGIRNIDQFLQNPIVLWAHQRTLPPIGVCQHLDVLPDRIVAETKFSSSSPLAMDVFRLYAEGILRGWSIGFVPHRAFPVKKFQPESGMRIEEWDLLEYSAVPIPENPQALTIAIQKGIVRDADLSDWFKLFVRQDILADLLV